MRSLLSTILFILVYTGTGSLLSGQDLESFLSEQMAENIEYTMGTFKSSRIMNGHSIESMPEGSLDFRISHRFGTVNSGAYEFFGLDQAHIHLGLEYGITDWIMIGVGRGTFEKTVDGFTKIRLLRQSTGVRNIPLSITYLAGIYINGLHWSDPERENQFDQRLSYAHQIMIARKFSPAFSLQISPAYLHRNLAETKSDPNDIFALGAGTRLKLYRRISFSAEYFYLFKPDNELRSIPIYNPLSLGVEIETGGHVFQVIVTNSVGMQENSFLGQTTGQWLHGDIHIGFNISRVFQLKK
jgi:hypothetical protein